MLTFNDKKNLLISQLDDYAFNMTYDYIEKKQNFNVLERIGKSCLFLGTVMKKVELLTDRSEFVSLEKYVNRLIKNNKFFNRELDKFIDKNDFSRWF